MHTILAYSVPAAELLPVELPLYGCPVPAGFPSPADDHQQDPSFDLKSHLFRNPASTFLARVIGDSMTGAEIHPGDLIAVDRAIAPRDGHVVVAVLEGEHTVKRLRIRGPRVYLEAANERYPTLELLPGTQLEVWGVVTHVVHALHGRPAAQSLAEWRRRSE